MLGCCAVVSEHHPRALSSNLPSGPSASALHAQPGRDPRFLALAVLPHVCVAHGRQVTGGLLRGESRRVPAVEHHLGVLVGEQGGRQLADFAGRKVQSPRQVGVPVVLRGQHLEEYEGVSLIYLRLQFLSADVRYHSRRISKY